MNMRKLYYQIPMPLKRITLSLIPYQLIAGKNYTNTLKLCKYLDHADTGEIIAFQEKQLKKLLDYAVNKVPFYKPYKNRLHNVNNYRDALNYFPVISKKIVQEKFHDFISDDVASIRYNEAVFDHAARFQYYQEKPGKLDILIVPTEKWVASDTEKILELHRKKVGDELDIKVIMTDHIPLTPAGKQMTVRLGYKPEGL